MNDEKLFEKAKELVVVYEDAVIRGRLTRYGGQWRLGSRRRCSTIH